MVRHALELVQIRNYKDDRPDTRGVAGERVLRLSGGEQEEHEQDGPVSAQPALVTRRWECFIFHCQINSLAPYLGKNLKLWISNSVITSVTTVACSSHYQHFASLEDLRFESPIQKYRRFKACLVMGVIKTRQTNSKLMFHIQSLAV
ncbi:hypothetical protein EVAR_13345_1 [Eumeta japonica]|uniref:Uncharacterized protein n=1 Tax=Eumeta variegata TaxID=151549 RepID=A0A4C1TRV6_EUMVA|nr:hypothetical protein EVAR_13345_1 [Eumeta japonica]